MYKLNIGNSDFKKLRLNGEYFVDKLLLIKDVLDGGEEYPNWEHWSACLASYSLRRRIRPALSA
jgi:hypothetical protein